MELTENNSLTILHAESGAGKTSLLKAGLRPHLLASGHVPVYISLSGLPPNIPIQKIIKQSLLPEIEEHSSLANASLHTFLREATSWLGKKWLVVIIDQFEEIFTMQSKELRESFVQEFSACINDDLLPVRWVLSLRSEWFGQLSTFRPYISHPFRSDYFLRALSLEESRQAIIEPARQLGIVFDEQLANEILGDLGKHNIYPPQLQLVCSELFNTRGANTLITTTAYESLGRANGILNGYFHKVLNRVFSPNQKIVAQRLLVALIASDKQISSRTKDELKAELSVQGTDITQLDDIVNQLVDHRMLRVVLSDIEGVPSLLLAHEYLIDKIELDKESLRRKVAQELIEKKIPYFERDKLLLSSGELAIVLPQEKWLHLTTKAEELIRQSKASKIKNEFFFVIIILTGMVISPFLINFFKAPLITIMPTPSTVPPLSSSEYSGGGGINIIYVFWMYAFLSATLGWARGWAKELLVAFSVILALALNFVIRRYIPLVSNLSETDPSLFWVRMIILLVLLYFGYQAVIIVPHLASRSVSENLQDTLFGAFLGWLNGYLAIGSILYYIHIADYSFQNVITKPTNPAILEVVNHMMLYMPPQVLGEPAIYFAVILAFVFVLVVYI